MGYNKSILLERLLDIYGFWAIGLKEGSWWNDTISLTDEMTVSCTVKIYTK